MKFYKDFCQNIINGDFKKVDLFIRVVISISEAEACHG